MGDIKAYNTNMIDDVRSKLATLPQGSRVRCALSDQEIEKISRAVESERIEDLRGRSYPPLFVLVHKLDVSQINDLDSDIELVLSRTKPRDAGPLLLKQLLEDRKYRAGIFEIYAKSQLLKADETSVELDSPLPNGCNADMRLSLGGREFYLECTILSESNEDRKRLEELIEAKKSNPSASQSWMGSFLYDAIRLYYKVYDKLARNWNPKKSQLSDAHPSVLVISLFVGNGSVSAESPGTRFALETLFSESLGNPEEEQSQPPENASLRGWLHDACIHGRNPLTENEYKTRYLDLLSSRKKISGILLFQDCELKESRVNYSANHRITHGEMARLEELFASSPRWWP
ncbi:MAG: hypothetical protein Q7T82_08580 [Armatimonadota bacterium]|nr:hypothetical protein [Armatimonadota bacterium]